jgi:subtilisin family serine protease
MVVFGASSAWGSEFRPNEVLVKYKEGVRRDRLTMEGIYDAANVVKVKRLRGGLRQFEQLVLASGTDVRDAIARLEKNPQVEYAQPNFILKAMPVVEGQNSAGVGRRAPTPNFASKDGIPCIPGMEIPGCTPLPCLMPNWPPGCKDDGGGDKPGDPPSGRPPVADKPAEVSPPVADPELSKAYGIAKIGATQVWEKNKGSQDIVVAVIDTGVDYNHEDLSYNMWRNPNGAEKGLVGWDFIHNDNLPFDDNQHGTHCAGTIGAVGGNGKGVSGVNQRVSIMALKFLSGEGSGDTAGAIQAIDYAVQNGARVLSNSWGGRGDDDNKGLRDAIKRAEDKGVLFIAAAGNDGTDNDSDPVFPAAFNAPNMVTVAATDNKDDMAFFSNFGKTTVHVGAPGMNVYSTVPGNGYATLSGTSMACPHVAGAAALFWAANPNMTHKEVKARLMDSVDRLPALEGKTVTGGRINIAKALGSQKD